MGGGSGFPPARRWGRVPGSGLSLRVEGSVRGLKGLGLGFQA